MAETTDERWRACKDLGTLGPVLKDNSEEIDKVYNLLKDVLEQDSSGICRYHAVLSLCKICPHIQKKRPEVVFDIANLVVGTGLKDDYDRVRRGAMSGLWILAELPSKSGDLHRKVREACMKQLQEDAYDVVRMDSCSLTGKLGVPGELSFAYNRCVKPLDDVAARDKEQATLKNDLLLIYLARFACYRLDRIHGEIKVLFSKEMTTLYEKIFVQFEHWSYWPQRECIARCLAQLGPMVTWLPKPLNQILDMLEQMSQDMVWDVRAAACKALGDLCPAPMEGKKKTQNQIKVAPVLWERATPILRRALRDDNLEVQEAAAKALRNGPDAPLRSL